MDCIRSLEEARKDLTQRIAWVGYADLFKSCGGGETIIVAWYDHCFRQAATRKVWYRPRERLFELYVYAEGHWRRAQARECQVDTAAQARTIAEELLCAAV